MKNDIESLPTNLTESIRYFSDPMVCLKTVAAAKWPNGPVCPRCALKRLSFLQTRLMWKCLDCKKQFTVKVGTIFEDSPIRLDKWLTAMWMLANCKNGVSSHEISRAIHVTQKTAWFMLQRLRHAMHTQSISKMAGEVEAGETFIGGKARNMRREKREDKITGMGGKIKQQSWDSWDVGEEWKQRSCRTGKRQRFKIRLGATYPLGLRCTRMRWHPPMG